MRSLLYLLFLSYKNSLRQLLVNPGKLIFTLLIIALLVSTAIFGSEPPAPGESYAPLSQLTVMVLGLYLLIFYTSAKLGFSRGASFYGMSDVNLLFTAPLRSQSILIYGLIKQMGTSLWVGFFLLFQFAWLNSRFGITFGNLVVIILGFCLVYFTGQLTAMAIYMFCAEHDRRRTILKSTIIVLCALLAVWVGYPLLSAPAKLTALFDTCNRPWADWLPIVGWMKAAVSAGISQQYGLAALWLLPWLLFCLLFVRLVSKSHGEFYEDVLSASEYSYNLRATAQSGNIAENVPTQVKTGKSGFRHGQGPWIFFFKHLRENRRTKLPFLDTGIIMSLVSAVIFALITQGEGILPVFIFATYMQIFVISMGRWNKELLKPYVYLIPANNFHKLLAILAESLLKNFIDAIVVFTAVGLLLHLSPSQIAACVIARFGFSLILLAANILSERVMGGLNSKMLLLTLYFLLLLTIAAPGILLAVLLAEVWGLTSLFGGLAISCLWNAAAALLIILCCRNVLRTPEIKLL